MRHIEAVAAIVGGIFVMFLSVVGAFGAESAGTGAFIGILIILIGAFYLVLKKPAATFKVCPYCKRQLPLTAAYCDRCGNVVR